MLSVWYLHVNTPTPAVLRSPIHKWMAYLEVDTEKVYSW